jgi:hypothetical protein
VENDKTDKTPQKRTARWRAKFLDALAKSGNVLLACRSAGIGRATAYVHRNRFPVFAQKWDDAIDESIDIMEAEARRRAIQGTERRVFYQGGEIDVVRDYSDVLLIFLLKAHRPERFRDNYDLRRLIGEYSERLREAPEPPPGNP